MKTAKIGGYEFTHVLDTKQGAVIHLLVEDGIVTKVQNDNGRIKAIEGKSLEDAKAYIKRLLYRKFTIIAI